LGQTNAVKCVGCQCLRPLHVALWYELLPLALLLMKALPELSLGNLGDLRSPCPFCLSHSSPAVDVMSVITITWRNIVLLARRPFLIKQMWQLGASDLLEHFAMFLTPCLMLCFRCSSCCAGPSPSSRRGSWGHQTCWSTLTRCSPCYVICVVTTYCTQAVPDQAGVAAGGVRPAGAV
jgi:hypothetical protein